MKMQNTATLIAEMNTNVAHCSFRIVSWVSHRIAIRLMIICISSWISKTQKKSIKNKTGTLWGSEELSAFFCQVGRSTEHKA